jgi:hypothetical protein
MEPPGPAAAPQTSSRTRVRRTSEAVRRCVTMTPPLIDRFGIAWLVNIGGQAPQG